LLKICLTIAEIPGILHIIRLVNRYTNSASSGNLSMTMTTATTQDKNGALKPAGSRERRVTITDVARAAGVSRTTVSYVLSERADARVPEPTRRRILDAAAGVGYRHNALAVAFRSGHMNTIGIVCPVHMLDASPGHTGNVYYRDLLLALVAAGFEAGLNPLFLSEQPSKQVSLTDITDRRADGVILVVKENAEAFVREAESAGVPCVTVGREYGAWQVHTDNRLGARLAVQHLLDLGHRRIGYLWHGKEQVPSARARRDGFLEALKEAGVTGESGADEFTDKNADSLIDALRAKNGPTAVFCYNDELAVQLLDLCHAAALRVPDDVSIVGFDDNILAVTARPRLTTVRSPLSDMARVAIELFQAQMRGESPPSRPAYLAPILAVRDSSGPPPILSDLSTMSFGFQWRKNHVYQQNNRRENRPWLYPDRASRCHRHYSDPCRDPLPCLCPGEGESPSDRLHV
jgi:LacI family transcriptional regulator